MNKITRLWICLTIFSLLPNQCTLLGVSTSFRRHGNTFNPNWAQVWDNEARSRVMSADNLFLHRLLAGDDITNGITDEGTQREELKIAAYGGSPNDSPVVLYESPPSDELYDHVYALSKRRYDNLAQARTSFKMVLSDIYNDSEQLLQNEPAMYASPKLWKDTYTGSSQTESDEIAYTANDDWLDTQKRMDSRETTNQQLQALPEKRLFGFIQCSGWGASCTKQRDKIGGGGNGEFHEMPLHSPSSQSVSNADPLPMGPLPLTNNSGNMSTATDDVDTHETMTSPRRMRDGQSSSSASASSSKGNHYQHAFVLTSGNSWAPGRKRSYNEEISSRYLTSEGRGTQRINELNTAPYGNHLQNNYAKRMPTIRKRWWPKVDLYDRLLRRKMFLL